MSTPPFASRLKTRHLVLLAQLDRDRSVLKAAEAIGTSQPAASKLLRELEQALGVPLFERHARGVVPTAYGDVLIRHALSVMSEMRRAQEEVDSLKAGRQLSVAIGTVMYPGTRLVPQTVARLAELHPQLQVVLDMDFSLPLMARLKEGRLDIAIARMLDPTDAADVQFEPLAEEPHSLVVRPAHPLARRRRLALEDLVDQAWILPPSGSILRERLDAMFLQRGLSLPARVVETSSLPITTNLLWQSDMVVALPPEVVQPYCSSGLLKILPVDLGVRMDSFGLITRRGRRLSQGATEALGVLREVAAQLFSPPPA